MEALLGYLFREHHLVSLHHNLMMHIPGISKCMVRVPFGQEPRGFVIVQGYSWLVHAMLHSLRLGASLARLTAAVIRLGSPGVYMVQWCSGLVHVLLRRVRIWLGTPWACHSPGLFLVSMCIVT